MVYAIYYCKRYGEDKEKIQQKSKCCMRKVLLSFKRKLFCTFKSGYHPWMYLHGIASPTEAAVISVFYALIVSLFIYKIHEV